MSTFIKDYIVSLKRHYPVLESYQDYPVLEILFLKKNIGIICGK
ncbi:unknown [Butyrivibrio sp. CAG:318]|nr:unknown [Butyrivibrio sp. CAG:318]